MKLRMLAVTATAAVAALAGCGGGSGNRPSAGSSDNSTFLEAARCMRTHGYPDWPDPVRFDDGKWGFPDSAPDVEPPAACADLFFRGKDEQAPKPPASAEYMAQIRKWADCMRAHGVPDWPDPDSDGYFDPPARLRVKDNAELYNAEKACNSVVPSEGYFMKPVRR